MLKTIALITTRVEKSAGIIGISFLILSIIACGTSTTQPIDPRSPTSLPQVATDRALIVSTHQAQGAGGSNVNVNSMDRRIYYAHGATNLRSCPNRSCEILVVIPDNGAVESIGYANGENVNAGNNIWYQVVYESYVGFVYSSRIALTQNVPTDVPRQILIITSTPPPVVNFTPVQPQVIERNWVCTGDLYNCGDLTGGDLLSYWNACPGDPSGLDRDHDGHPCEDAWN